MFFQYFVLASASAASVFLAGVYGVVFRKLAIRLQQTNNQTLPVNRLRAYVGVLTADFAIAGGLAYLIYQLEITSLLQALELTFWLLTGFVIPITFGAVLWEGKPFGFWLFHTIINAICLFAMVLIITFWR